MVADGPALPSTWSLFNGLRLDMTLVDWMHAVPLGCARNLCGSALCTMLEGNMFASPGGERSDDVQLQHFTREFRAWMHGRGMRRPICSVIMKGLRSSKLVPPELPRIFKAITIKHVVAFLAMKFARGPCRLSTAELVTLARCYRGMDKCKDTHFTEDECKHFLTSLRSHLKALQRLNERASAEGVREWHIRPKVHMLLHLANFVERTRLNPLRFICFDCENFIGKPKRPGQKWSGRAVSVRLLEKICVGLSLRWRQGKS